MAVTQTARRITATLLSGSLAPECDNVIRYDWTEYALIIDWAPGHEQYGKSQTRSVVAAMTLADAQADAKRGRTMLVEKLGMATKIRLVCQTRTCTIELTHTPDTHEDGDGTPRRHTRVIAGSRWADRRETDRELWREAIEARETLERNLHDDPNAAERWAAEHAA